MMFGPEDVGVWHAVAEVERLLALRRLAQVEPWCNHDEVAVNARGVCECGVRVLTAGEELMRDHGIVIQ